MNKIMHKQALPLLIISICLIGSAAQAGKFKKWIDDKGVVQYGTSIPPQYVNGAHSELNSRGIEVDRSTRTKSLEERAREKEIANLRLEQDRIKEEQTAKDRVLLNMFRTSEDIILVRDGKVAQVEAQITHKKKYITRLKARLLKWQNVAAAAERRGSKLTKTQQQNLDSSEQQIEQSYAAIIEKEVAQQAIVDKYNLDLEHFRDLKKIPNDQKTVIPDKISDKKATLVDTVILCATDSDCEQVWRRAIYYAQQHATTEVKIRGERILVTGPARKKNDISITVSHIIKGGHRIFLDLDCHSSLTGQALCKSKAVKSIRKNFRKEVGGWENAVIN